MTTNNDLDAATVPARPLPPPDDDSLEYWKAAAEHRLVMQRCSSCSTFRFYPRSICGECQSPEFTWTEVAGTGTVYTYTVVRRAPLDSFRHLVPYVLALVELDEGPRMMTNIIDAVDDVHIGQRVTVAWTELTPDVSLPVFRAAGG